MNAEFELTMSRALEATKRDAADESERLCQHAMALEPRAAIPHYLRATNLAHAGRYELAEASYMASLTRAPDFAIARFQLGLLQLTGHRPAIAHASWEPLLELADEHPLKLFVQGFLAILEENWDRAREVILRGIERNHENAPLNDDMAGVLRRIDALQTGDRRVPGGAVAETSAAHFLIGTYRQQ